MLEELDPGEVRYWLREFANFPAYALSRIPNKVYGILRHEGLIDIEGYLSDRAQALAE